MAAATQKKQTFAERIKLPEPRLDSAVSIEQVLRRRRSTREFSNQPIELSHVSQLVWAAQGITGPEIYRTAPSAGGLYALDLYVVAGHVSGLPPGLYRYDLRNHELALLLDGDIRRELSGAALDQSSVSQAAAIFGVSAVYQRITSKYGERGVRYAHMEAGHAAQNLLLQAVALDLGAVLVGAFDDGKVKRVLGMSKEEQPLYLIPVGKP
jgi:SagB-type dehydrogenase family enzyme